MELMDEIKAMLVDTGAKVALAKDRIFLEYLASQNLVGDYEEWVGALNEDPIRMERLVFGEEQ